MTESKDFGRPYFKERFMLQLDELEREELIRRAEAQKLKESYQRRTGPPLKKYAVEYSYCTNIHGVRSIFEERSWCEKIFWTVVVALGVGGCLWAIYVTLFWYKVSIYGLFGTYRTPIHRIFFPAVTICPLREYVNDILEEAKSEEGAIPELQEEEKLRDYTNVLCHGYMHEGAETLDEGFFKVLDVIKSKLDIFSRCELFDNQVNCQELFFPILTPRGVCFSFNLHTKESLFTNSVYFYGDFFKTKPTTRLDFRNLAYPIKAVLSKPSNGLRVTLKFRKHERDGPCRPMYRNFRVCLHNPESLTCPIKSFFFVPPEQYVTVCVKPSMMETHGTVMEMPLANRNCFIKGEKTLKYFGTYTKYNCQLECLIDFVAEKCKCVEYHMMRLKETPVCGPKRLHCVQRAKEQFRVLDKNSEVLEGHDLCDCKHRCEYVLYAREASHCNWNWREFFENQWDDNIIEENSRITNQTTDLSLLLIYFQSSSFHSVQKYELHGITTLLSELGGLLSFFTGMSFIAAVELVYFLTLRILVNMIKYGTWAGPR